MLERKEKHLAPLAPESREAATRKNRREQIGERDIYRMDAVIY